MQSPFSRNGACPLQHSILCTGTCNEKCDVVDVLVRPSLKFRHPVGCMRHVHSLDLSVLADFSSMPELYQSWVPAPVLLNCRCKRSVSKSHVRPSMLPATRHTAALTFQKVIHDANGECLRVTYLGIQTPFFPSSKSSLIAPRSVIQKKAVLYQKQEIGIAF